MLLAESVVTGTSSPSTSYFALTYTTIQKIGDICQQRLLVQSDRLYRFNGSTRITAERAETYKDTSEQQLIRVK